MNITWNTISPAPPAKVKAVETVLDETLSTSGNLAEFLELSATADEPVLLIVNDPHRSTQTRPVLVAIAKHQAGAAVRTGSHRRAARFRAIVATGTHGFSIQESHEFEQAMFAGCGLNVENVTWHDATDADSLADVAGVRMHRWVADSRFLLPIGSVEPHYFAGLTGPHKTVTIGCMSIEDIERNHAGAMSPASEILRLEGNPVHDDTVEILHRLEATGKIVCAIGEVVCGGVLLAAAVGDPIGVLVELFPTVRRIYVRTILEPVDVLRLRVPLPLGRNLYQADKALKNNHLAVRDGGGIILEADCGEGIGPDDFMNLLRGSSDYALAQQIVARRGYRLGDHKAVKLRYLTDPAHRGVHVALVTPHVAESEVTGTGIRVFREVASALDWLSTVVAAPFATGMTIEDAGMITVTPTRT